MSQLVLPNLVVRPLRAGELEVVYEVVLDSVKAMDFLPAEAPPPALDLISAFARGSDTLLAEHDGQVVSALARRGREIPLLYTRRAWFGKGAGTLLVEAAKTGSPLELVLTCFQANARARRFYEARGFEPTGVTDGSENPERLPCIHYRWSPRWGRAAR